MASIAIIGGGPAGLFAADRLAGAGHGVTIYDRMPSPCRKFLMAGRGGLNLTHSEPFERFLARYPDLPEALEKAIRAFPPDALRDFAADSDNAPSLAQRAGLSRGDEGLAHAACVALAVGSEGRDLKSRHEWQGWNEAGALLFATPSGPVS